MPLYASEDPEIRKKLAGMEDPRPEGWLWSAIQSIAPDTYRTGRRLMAGQYDNPKEALTDWGGSPESQAYNVFPNPIAGGMVKAVGAPGAATRLLQSFAPKAAAPRASLGIKTTPLGQQSLWDIKGEPKGILELIRHIQKNWAPEEIDSLRIGPLMPKPDIYNFAKGMAERSTEQFPNFAQRLSDAADMARVDAERYGIPWK